jgi:hypothetical protein
VRAILLDRAVPGDADTVRAGDLVRLSDAAYHDRRADENGVAGRPRARCSPEMAATAAIARLRNDELPKGFNESTGRGRRGA